MPEIHSKKTSSHSFTMGTWNLKYHMLLCNVIDFTFSNTRKYTIFTILPKMNSKQLYSNLIVCISYVAHNRNSMCLTAFIVVVVIVAVATTTTTTTTTHYHLYGEYLQLYS
jgi:hypothetical protein